ncbi:MAG: ABC transporter permease [Clostridiales bacterium]|nr:ABC transporter permease [Clostridiales bacterium]
MKPKFKRTYFAFPYALLCVLFVVVPLGIMLYFACTDFEGSFTFDNFGYFFTESETQLVLLKSVGTALLATVICFLLAYPLAYILASSPFNKTAILVMLFIIPMWINSLLRIYATRTFFEMIGIERGYFAVVIGLVYDFLPFMLLPIYTSLNNMDKSYLEASYDLGANPIASFFKVTFPLSMPGVVSGVLMVFMPAISTIGITEMLGNKDVYLFGNLINDYLGEFYTWNIGAAYSFIMLVLIAISMLIANKFGNGETTARGGTI